MFGFLRPIRLEMDIIWIDTITIQIVFKYLILVSNTILLGFVYSIHFMIKEFSKKIDIRRDANVKKRRERDINI